MKASIFSSTSFSKFSSPFFTGVCRISREWNQTRSYIKTPDDTYKRNIKSQQAFLHVSLTCRPSKTPTEWTWTLNDHLDDSLSRLRRNRNDICMPTIWYAFVVIDILMTRRQCITILHCYYIVVHCSCVCYDKVVLCLFGKGACLHM